MEKYHNKTFRVIAILFMLSTAPLAVSYSYAEDEEKPEPKTLQKDPNSSKKSQERLGVILTEKVVNGNLEVKEVVLLENTTKDDMNRLLSLEGTSGWSYIDYAGYHSGIVIFDGKTSEAGEKHWKISVNGRLNLSTGEINLELVGNSNSSNPKTTEDLSNENLGYRVIFSGKMLESGEKDEFAFAFMNSTQKNSETNPDTKILPFGNPALESGDSMDDKQKVRNTFF